MFQRNSRSVDRAPAPPEKLSTELTTKALEAARRGIRFYETLQVKSIGARFHRPPPFPRFDTFYFDFAGRRRLVAGRLRRTDVPYGERAGERGIMSRACAPKSFDVRNNVTTRACL